MSTGRAGYDRVIAISPVSTVAPSPRIVAAAAAGGGTGVLDLAAGDQAATRALRLAASWCTGPFGVRVPAGCGVTVEDIERAGDGRVGLAILEYGGPWAVRAAAERFRVLVEVTCLEEAAAAAAEGAHGLVARGMEAGGRVGELSSFVLLQRLLADPGLDLPVWVCGGVGPRTAVACVAGGAQGVVLDSQLGLMPESDLPDDVQAGLRRMDGSETVLSGQHRGVRRGGRRDEVAELLPIGQDGGLAATFARRWVDTAAAVRGIGAAISAALAGAGDAAALLAPGADLAAELGIRVPVAQGPMTRVSDVAAFAGAVAAEGGLPFLALALSSADQCRRMLTETAAALGDRAWGVGVLGFVPEDLRAAQLAVIREIRPRCAIVAGGRPAQANALEAEGIATFLHVPSPGLLRQFLDAGSRRFVFEGAECGGHVGPRASFPLWESQLTVLDEFLDGAPAGTGTRIQVFFAGGVHDARSAAMVAAMAAPLARRGVRVGVLMGTGYLFTREAVECGAILPRFQREALAATRTSLLETAPGHATRCLHSPFVDDFHGLQDQLRAAGVESRQMWEQLEMLNAGRLRIASKGKRRDGADIVDVDEETQAADGMFMAGQVAVLRDAQTTIAELHAAVTTGAGEWLVSRASAPEAAREEVEPARPLDIAIVGMACLFPNSPDLAGYWRTILDGVDAITEVPADRWDVDTYYAPEVGPGQAGRISVSKWGGFLTPVPFDAIRYGIPPSALGSIDPTQLLALEVAYRALVDAGYPHDAPGTDHSRTGVVFGAEAGGDLSNGKTLRTMLPGYFGEVPAQLEDELPRVTEDSFPGILANVIAGRVANRLDLGGPNFTVDAACASSLAALDAACKELLSGGSDLMLCGGADLHNGINDFLMFTSAHALSPTGRCRTFDSAGDGIALGEGVACVVLKRLADAERDGDRVYAVVKGLGAGSDGRALGLTAPRPEGQRRALERAYRVAGVSPRQVGLVEAHGTGTVVGDRTELETLTGFYAEAGARPGGCGLGSVKSQIGHTKCAAGLAGVIKATLALYHGIRPPTGNLTRPNPAWDPRRSPFGFYTQARPWSAPAGERYAAVSAFGFGGTNYHAVLAGYPDARQPRHARDEWPAELFCFRGADQEDAHQAVRSLLSTVDADGDVRLRDLAAALARAGRPGQVRVCVVARDRTELVALLRRALAGEHDPKSGLIQPDATGYAGGKVAFLFPGQGSQRPGALADLFTTFPETRQFLDLGREWADLLFPPTAFDAETERAQEDQVRDTRVAQPVLGIGGLAVDHLLARSGVRPDLAAGHSYGELAALCVADAYDPETLLELSRERAAAILAAAGDDPGTMAAVAASAERVAEVLGLAGLAGEVTLANHNGPAQVVVSGPTPAVRAALAALQDAAVPARELPVACAFHSPVVAGGVTRFAEVLAGRRVGRPRMPVFANRTAAPYPEEPDGVRAELAAQIGAPVRFVEQVEAMYAAGARVFVEAGPGRVLTKLVRAILGDRPHLAVACDGRPGEGLRAFLGALGELACAGIPVQTEWLFRGRDTAVARPDERPMWTVDGQLVRDQHGNCLPGGLRPPRRVEELSMTIVGGTGAGRAGRDDVLSEFLRTSRELIASQRDVMLAYLGDADRGRVVWQPAESGQPVETVAPVLEVAPEPVPVAVPAPAPATRPALSTVDFRGTVLAVISERTGYPVDLLDVDLDLEADLSIDSIKRAEVAGEVAARLGLAAGGERSALEELVKARSVRSMVDWLSGNAGVPAPVAVASRPAVSTVDFRGTVLAVISERTGYPVDLLDVDLDLEADLSIDSIKRAEVAGEVAARLGLAAGGERSALEELVKARSVRSMVDWLSGNAGAPSPAPVPEPPPTAPEHRGIAPQRLVSRPVALTGAPVAGAETLAGQSFVVTGRGAAAERLAGLLRGHGVAVRRAVLEDGVATGLDGLIVLDGLDPDEPVADGTESGGAAALLPGAFGALRRALAAGPRRLLAVTDLAGDGGRTDGLDGLFRTIHQEYPDVDARAVAVDATGPADQVARELVDELLTGGRVPVVRREADGRHAVDVVPEGLGRVAAAGAGPAADGVAEAQAIGLDPDGVVVLFGGARGITPWFARALAIASRCRIELVGRTSLPEGPEDPELAHAADRTALCAVLARQGGRTPAEIDRAARVILAGREVTATLRELRELGSEVRYHTLDVRDEELTHRLLKEIHRDHRRIDGVVYAAGVIEDKLIADKDPASFARVYSTKVDGARGVLDAVAELPSAPRFTVLFGSIAATFGSRGQCDYAAANAALESLGRRWADRTGNRCLTVHWGPWAPTPVHGGMVTPELGREYARRGIALIDPEEGAASLLRELAWGDPALRAVVYTASRG